MLCIINYEYSYRFLFPGNVARFYIFKSGFRSRWVTEKTYSAHFVRKFKVFVAVEELPCGEFFVIGTRVVKSRARQKVARSIRKRANCGKRRRTKGNLTHNCHSSNREHRDPGGLKACIGCIREGVDKRWQECIGWALHKSEGKK